MSRDHHVHRRSLRRPERVPHGRRRVCIRNVWVASGALLRQSLVFMVQEIQTLIFSSRKPVFGATFVRIAQG